MADSSTPPRYTGPRALAESLSAFAQATAPGARWDREGRRDDAEYRDLGPAPAMAVTVAARRSAALLAWLRNRGGALAIFVLLFLLWEFAVRLTDIKEYLLPPPSKVWTEFWRRHELVTAGAWVTTREILAGYALAVVVSIPLALAVAYSRFMEQAVYPVIVFLQIIPKIAIAPLFII